MATNVERYAVDTSVAVAALDAGHAAHQRCRAIVVEHSAGLAGHAAFETYSVLTRMPGALAIDGPTAADLIAVVFPLHYVLGEEQTADLRARLGPVGIVGGAVYDALVGAAAAANECRLISRDLRARSTYARLGIDVEYV